MILTDILRKQILSKMKADNPWWDTGKIFEDYASMQKRLYFSLFYPMVKDLSIRRAIILLGPRRVGKSVMLFHTIEKLIQDGVFPSHIVYLSVDTPLYNGIALEELFLLAKEAIGESDEKDPYFVFFDEIQYLKDWEQC